jgi:hypothetical protein
VKPRPIGQTHTSNVWMTQHKELRLSTTLYFGKSNIFGDARFRSRYLAHAKRALYQLSMM